MVHNLEHLIESAAGFIWGAPLLILLLGGGVFFMFYSGFLPFRFLRHAVNVLVGKYDDKNDPGQINHFQALSGALAATIGMGNISGVAIAIATGGPGAIFWMWVSAFFGMATKFFTCSLAIMYRAKDENGEVQGGPMYFIQEGLGKKWKWLAISFGIFGSLGATPIFQTHQTVDAFRNIVLEPLNISSNNFAMNLTLGLLIALVVGLVIFGGVKRIATVASRLVPSMVVLYSVSVIIILILNFHEVIPSLSLIVTDAFTANSVLGGAVGTLIVTGARRAAFSNEAGIGTAPMMHGAAKTSEPIREGLVAMLGPAIDTLIVCTMTGLAILVTGAWQTGDLDGILLTAKAFEISLPVVGPYILLLCVMIFAITTIFGLAYYGRKCFTYLTNQKVGDYFNYWYIFLIPIASISSFGVIISFVDLAYGLMAFPTMIGAMLLAPGVKKEAKKYFSRLND